MIRQIPELAGGGQRFGHLQELRHDPLGLFRRVRAECGELGRFRLLDREVVFFSGPEAQEVFFRQADEVFDPQPTSNEMMRPIFGEGVVYDTPPQERKEALRTPALRDKNLRVSAQIIAAETERTCDAMPGEGELDLLDFTAELTMNTSSACLIGPHFRESITPEFSKRYFELENGTDYVAYLDSAKDLASFRIRDQARAALVAQVSEVIAQRRELEEPPRDMLGAILSVKREDGSAVYSTDQVTGILIATMFAGHHTSAGTAAWTLVEMLRAPAYEKRVRDELERIYAGGEEVSYQALREIPLLENAVKEALRLHPPLIWLPRTALVDFPYKDWVVPAGTLVAASTALSGIDPDCFAEPERFDPDRFAAPRQEDLRQPWAYVPFGGGRHRCLGANFAMMQQKAVFSILLRRFDWELVDAAQSYRDNYRFSVVRPRQPFRVQFRRRPAR